MKRKLVVVMVMVIAMIMGTMYAAAETVETLTPEEGEYSASSSIAVTGTYVVNEYVGEMISVDVEWGAFEFEFNAEPGEWDPESLTPSASIEGYWEANESNTVTVWNRSSIDVIVSLDFIPSDELDNVTGFFEFDHGYASIGLQKPEIGDEDSVESAVAELIIAEGSYLPSDADGIQIGTATISVIRDPGIV